MLYPVYVHQEGQSAFGLIFPDFPGCFAAADEASEIPQAAQEAVEAHFHGDADPIPGASSPADWKDDDGYQGGFWMLVDIDLSRINARAVRLNISLPERLVHRIDEEAKQRHMSRSAFLALAAEREMAEHD